MVFADCRQQSAIVIHGCKYSLLIIWKQVHLSKIVLIAEQLNVAKCNLGKVNLKAMLSSWMQKLVLQRQQQSGQYMTPTRCRCCTRAPKASGPPKLFAGTPCDPYTQPHAHTSYIRSWFAGAQSLGWPKL